MDYDGVMGVPITFLDKYNPDQFEIVGISTELAEPMSKYAAKRGTPLRRARSSGGPASSSYPLGDGKHTRAYYRAHLRQTRSERARVKIELTRSRSASSPRATRTTTRRASSATAASSTSARPYQREFIYKDKQRDAVIDTDPQGLPAQRHVLGRQRRRDLRGHRRPAAHHLVLPVRRRRLLDPFEGQPMLPQPPRRRAGADPRLRADGLPLRRHRQREAGLVQRSSTSRARSSPTRNCATPSTPARG